MAANPDPFTDPRAEAILMSSPQEIEAMGAVYTRLSSAAAPIGADLSAAAAAADWQGNAAESFRELIGKNDGGGVTFGLSQMGPALSAAGNALNEYGDRLAALKSALENLLSQLKDVQSQLAIFSQAAADAQSKIDGLNREVASLKSAAAPKVAHETATAMAAAQSALSAANAQIPCWQRYQAEIYQSGWRILGNFDTLAQDCANDMSSAIEELPVPYRSLPGASFEQTVEAVLLGTVHAFENAGPDFMAWWDHKSAARFSKFLGDLGTIVVTVGAVAAVAIMPADAAGVAGLVEALEALDATLDVGGLGAIGLKTDLDIYDAETGRGNWTTLFADALAIATTEDGAIDTAPLEQNLDKLEPNYTAVNELEEQLKTHPDVATAIDYCPTEESRELLEGWKLTDMSPEAVQTFIATTKAVYEAQEQALTSAKALAAAANYAGDFAGNIPSEIQQNTVPPPTA